MIETIANLIKQSGASRVNLSIMIDPNDDNIVNIIMNTFMPTAKQGKTAKEESADVIKLRHALSAPLAIHGSIGEVDVSLEQEVTQFAYGFKKGADLLNTASDLISNIETASSDVNAKPTAKKTTTNGVASTVEKEIPHVEKPVSSAFVHTDDDDDDSL